MQRRVILYIAMSLDGFIAGENDDLRFLETVQVEGEDYGYESFQQEIDTLIWGRKTYDVVQSFGIEFPHKDKTCYVISSSRSGHNEYIEYRSDVVSLIQELKSKPGKHIYCDGGASIVNELLKHNLLDELRITIIPHLVGKGVRLFSNDRDQQTLQLTRTVSFPTGAVQNWYTVIHKTD
ncbi:MAG: dihydrofolate reductase family protein [Bacteroidota bacterium]